MGRIMIIYNLFPSLIGKISGWSEHLPRIKSMKFNWIYINPINYPGFSGSLYSIKDHFRLNPRFAIDADDEFSWQSFKDFINKAHDLDLKIMLDLVINHTAIDAVNYEAPSDTEIPFKESWYKKKFALIEICTNQVIRFFEDTEDPVINEYPPEDFKLELRIANPFAIDPADANRVTIWGDLAELDYNGEAREEIISYWKKLIKFYLDIGVDGFRCDAAYKVERSVWDELISYAKSINPNVIFWAETLGCTLEQYKSISTKFDYIANSVKYWDFTANWAVEQYNEFRRFAPSISFPESHDTLRLAYETGGRKDVQVFRYFFSCFFTSGVMMPIGYEFGFKKRLSVTDTDPKDWEEPLWDISDEISRINEFKISQRVLQEDGPITMYPYPDSNILLLKKEGKDLEEALFLIYNKNWHETRSVSIDLNDGYLTPTDAIKRIIDLRDFEELSNTHLEITLKPNDYILLYCKKI